MVVDVGVEVGVMVLDSIDTGCGVLTVARPTPRLPQVSRAKRSAMIKLLVLMKIKIKQDSTCLTFLRNQSFMA